ncbi:zinc finger protein zpr1 [Quercus suber]|uniref:Zinc finger protein zpr1 n=1 Tax=Quercus suber TaxID=58331 RepID=A0AAW0MBS8_QUESU
MTSAQRTRLAYNIITRLELYEVIFWKKILVGLAFEGYPFHVLQFLSLEEPWSSWTLILDDALANSFIAPVTEDIKDDHQLTFEEYERSWEQNEELGLNDIDTSSADAAYNSTDTTMKGETEINTGFDTTTTMGTVARVMCPRLLRSTSSTTTGMNDSYYIPSYSAMSSLGLDLPTPCGRVRLRYWLCNH